MLDIFFACPNFFYYCNAFLTDGGLFGKGVTNPPNQNNQLAAPQLEKNKKSAGKWDTQIDERNKRGGEIAWWRRNSKLKENQYKKTGLDVTEISKIKRLSVQDSTVVKNGFVDR